MHCAVLSRRGQVKRIRSDNWTNFIGAERELTRSIEEWNNLKFSQRYATEKNMASFFWHRWVREHVSLLQKQHKEKQVGDIVNIVDFNAPRSSWRIAAVHETRTSASGKSENRDKYLGSPCWQMVFKLGNGLRDCLYFTRVFLKLFLMCMDNI